MIADKEYEALLHGTSREEIKRLVEGRHHNPHSILGCHPLENRHQVIRAWHPQAVSVDFICGTAKISPQPMSRIDEAGLFALLIKDQSPSPYKFIFHFADGSSWITLDPYAFSPTLGELDLYLISEGRHQRLYDHLGAHPLKRNGIDGVAFALWAPNAERVSVVGDFNQWDGLRNPLRSLGSSGIWEIFIPELPLGTIYKYEIRTPSGDLRLKTDPLAFMMELRPQNASKVFDQTRFTWDDAHWQKNRIVHQKKEAPLVIYEVHLGSWKRCTEENNRSLTYRELAPQLVSHVKELGFTHIELLPVSEYPFDGSWGYQVSGYYAPTSRYGNPDDFKFFVDYCHQHEIGVILDWVPAHFPKDDFSLRLFDGSALYEHADPRLGEHPDWGTLIFNFGRPEVANFLIANAHFWFDYYHVDGLRVDAVASMLYLDYSRKEGQWLPNYLGGRENLEAIAFLRELNSNIEKLYPDRLMIAEESTSWPGVSRPTGLGGLGFHHKWNMGWMNDTLDFFAIDPLYRSYHHNQITFSIMYAFSEHFLLPFSHDEVVHGKGSLLTKMPGDDWQKFANLRLLLSYQFTHPGKKLLFMGTEIASDKEWNFAASLDWHLLDHDAGRQKFFLFCRDLIQLYRRLPALWEKDDDDDGFAWIDCHDHRNSILIYQRRGTEGKPVICIINLTPLTHNHYRIGLPGAGEYREIFNSDAALYGGSNQGNQGRILAEEFPFHNLPASASLTIPPLAALLIQAD
ncbi:MAG: 1,4-alpha-glucan branching protein GlgB [Deltaproteobacteria bacterium]|nr:1,4-alpha-glucan branching protein GlgB [Deltaproteobacteria bacterium]